MKRENFQSTLRVIDIDGETRLVTLNLVPGQKVYNERTILIEGSEFRIWDPFRSKLAAALLKGMRDMPIVENGKILYLGTSTGTTPSHVSDIIGKQGILFGVEVASRVAREFVENVASKRSNIIPIIKDARKPEEYSSIYTKVDIVYCDIAQPDQTQIAILNCDKYLKKGGTLMLVVKARSIDSLREPSIIFREESAKLEECNFDIKQLIRLDPFDKDHAIIIAAR